MNGHLFEFLKHGNIFFPFPKTGGKELNCSLWTKKQIVT